MSTSCWDGVQPWEDNIVACKGTRDKTGYAAEELPEPTNGDVKCRDCWRQEGNRHQWEQVLATVAPKWILQGRDHVLSGKPGHSVSRCSLQTGITESGAFRPNREVACSLRFNHWTLQWTSSFCLVLPHFVSETGSRCKEQDGFPTHNPPASASWALGLVLCHQNITCHSSLKSVAQGHEWWNIPSNRI